ncbi:MAG: nitroreductase family deazaflavin-dependent oxidoreductase [Nocardioides sp.]|uniref:nitroreductase family deazaflavin-dependent oxidoreductase n=1 Tax=Nocardioides sp. TaxID=35761 RepID=UPI003EFDDF78
MNPLRPVALALGAQPWLPKFAKVIVGLDRGIQGATKGRLTLLQMAGLPELMLSVVGRKSGLVRTTPLLCVPHDGGWLVAGSNWGAPSPPAWVGNLLAAGEASVNWHGTDVPVTARRVEGAEREALWAVMLGTWPNYAKYAERTDREIPVFRLDPR